jgi:arginase family enzyme
VNPTADIDGRTARLAAHAAALLCGRAEPSVRVGG